VPKGTIVPFITFLFHEVRTYFKVVTEVALFTIGARAISLEFVTWFNFAFVMWILAGFSLPTLTMDKLFTDSIGG
jgi:hypothetical protein